MNRSDAEILGREHIDDVEFLTHLAQTNTAADELAHEVTNNADTLFTWDYSKGARPRLERLYEKAKTSQWNGETDLPWDTEVDPYRLFDGIDLNAMPPTRDQLTAPAFSPLKNWGDAEWEELGVESIRWRMSQFLHGEQGALVCTAKIVETVPWIDAKYYAATQVVDEARHVEVFNKYLSEKLGGDYPINVHLQMLLDDIVNDSRWDMTYLGMQIMVEGLALAAFGMMRQTTSEPLLEQLLKYVMADEARHVAFGVLSLQEVYGELTAGEIRERQEFAFEAAVRMRDRFLQQEVWERMGVDSSAMARIVLEIPAEEQLFQQLLFSKIVPNCKKLGLLDGGDGWLRKKFTEIGVIQFEDLPDTSEEYLEFDTAAA
jgi:hypothetical protein